MNETWVKNISLGLLVLVFLLALGLLGYALFGVPRVIMRVVDANIALSPLTVSVISASKFITNPVNLILSLPVLGLLAVGLILKEGAMPVPARLGINGALALVLAALLILVIVAMQQPLAQIGAMLAYLRLPMHWTP